MLVGAAVRVRIALAALGGLVAVVAALSLWHRQVERRRIAELRQARDLLATLERRLASTKDAATLPSASSSPEIVTVTGKGYPALYLDATRRTIALRRSPAHPLEEIIHGAEYDLLRHLIECLQAGWQQTHWIWSYVVWPTAQPKFPKEAFATHCTKLRKRIETVWQLGPVLGRGDRRTGAIPIEVKDVHFYTDAAPDGTAYPIWALFLTSEQATRAYKAGSWKTAHREIEALLRMDPENWLGNTLLCHLALQGHVAITDPLVQRAFEFVHAQKMHYEHALERIEALPAEKVDLQQMERIRSRYEALRLIASRALPPSPPTSPANERSPWRDRERLKAWLAYLDERAPALPDEEIKIIRGIQRFLRQRLPWASPSDVDEQFRSFLQDLACDPTSWPEERLPRSRRAFQSGALDYALARLYGLCDDAESKAITKAQNLRKLWDRRSHLRKTLQQDPTKEQLYAACRQRYGWSRAFFERVLELERAGQVRSWDERSSKRVI